MALAESVLKSWKLFGGGNEPALDSDRCVAIPSSLFRSLASVFVGEPPPPPPHDEAGESSLLMMSPTFRRKLSADASVPLLLAVPLEGALLIGDRHKDGLGLLLGLRLSGDGKNIGRAAADGSAASSNMRDFLLFGGAAESGVFDVEGVGESAFSLAKNMSHMSCGAMKLLLLPRLADVFFFPDVAGGGVAAARVRDMSSSALFSTVALSSLPLLPSSFLASHCVTLSSAR